MDDLEEHGFMRHELSLLADDATIEEKLGHVYKRVALAQDDPAAPRTIFIPKETRGDAQGALIAMPLYIAASTASAVVVASGGTILSALAAASAAGAVGTAIGAALASFVAKHHANYILSQLERGGLLLWVNLRNPEQEELAKKILKRHSSHNIHTHKIPLYG
jgi:isopentenyl diphosphate isomerase/L-lactate dehydrogenase-like FMN-dependent dehydrogenase